MKILNFNPKKGKAQAMVEFAIVLPILLLVVYGLIEAGRLIFIYSSVNNATRQASRYGSTSGVGPNGVPRYQDCAGIREAAQRGDFLDAFDDADISIGYDRPSAGNSDPADFDTCDGATDSGVNAQTGDRVVVTINADFNAIVPNLVPFISRTVAGGNPIIAESSRTLLLKLDIEPPKENTVTLITADTLDPSEIGQYVMVSVTVTAETTPTGTVTITGADENCSITLGAGGSGSCTVRFTSIGTRTLAASYGGDDRHNPSNDTEDHTVIKASTVTNVVSDIPDPSVVNQPFTVTVSVSSAWATPTGTISITGADSSSCQPLSGFGGTATTTCQVTYAVVGPQLFTATYNGDGEHEVSDASETHNVLPPGQSTTTISPTSPDPSAPGQSVTVNVTVTGSVTPTGTVEVTVSGGVPGCTITLNNGIGSCPLTFPSNGSYTITANYPGDNNNQGSSDTESHAVSLPATTTTITINPPNSTTANQPVTMTVSVSGGSTPVTGTVTVTTPVGTFCTITLPATSCTGTFNIAGNFPLTATYSGDATHAPSSTTLNYSVSVTACNTVTVGLLKNTGGVLSMNITNPLTTALQIGNVSVTWNHDKGHQTGDDKTLILQSASLGSVFWTGTQIGPTYTITPAAATFIQPGVSTISFAFQQTFDRWDDTEQITINLSTPGCEGVILFQNQH